MITSIEELPPEIDQALKIVQQYAVLLGNKQQRDSALILTELLSLDGTVPLKWTGKGNYPYYKELYAKKVKEIVDLMVTEGKNRFLVSREFGVAKNTLMSMLVQGWMYLSERMDDEQGTYKTLRGRIELCKELTGIRLRWKTNITSSAAALSYTGTGEDVSHAPSFKNDLLEYLENGPEESKYEKVGLSLKDEQIEWIRDICKDIPNIFIMHLSSYKITIVRSSHAAKYKTQ